MAFGSRYTRVDPSMGFSEEQRHPFSPSPMEFSNNVDRSRPSNHPPASYHLPFKNSNASYMERPSENSPPTSSDLPAYEPYGNQYGTDRPKPPRQRTGISFISSISSAWDATRSTVSHFRVPKVAAPWEHEPSEKDALAAQQPSNTMREFDHRRQRRRLFVNSSFRLVLTAALCAALAAVLYGFSTIWWGMTQGQKKGFNALITGLSIIVGLNLSSSFKEYANMMRWRFLAAGYRSLQDFELIMSCESQQAVFRLLWAGRTRGRWMPNKIQGLALVWLLINIALQVVIALLGLTYSIDISENWVSTRRGDVTIADVSTIYVSTTQDFGISAQGAVAQNLGVTGQDYPVDDKYTFGSYSGGQQTIYTDKEGKMYWYTFVDQDPEGKQTVLSTRQISTTATCTDFKVIKGGYAGYDDETNPDPDNVTIELEDGSNSTFYVSPQTTGGTTWMITPDPTPGLGGECGPRCSVIFALQVATPDGTVVKEPRFWRCHNEVSHVTNYEAYGNASTFDMPDLQAWIMAGAIGFSGSTTTFDESTVGSQYMMYPAESYWSPPGTATAFDMASKIMMFTSGAFAAMDFNGRRITVENQQQPIPAQVVNVNWLWACVVLGSIPLTQAFVLLITIGFANKAVIRDGSYLASAKLLQPVVQKLGDRGCLLTGDEIAEELGNYKIIYGPRMPRGTTRGQEGEVVKHMDVIAESEGVDRWHGRMPAGNYDGRTTWGEIDVREVEEVEGLIDGRKAR